MLFRYTLHSRRTGAKVEIGEYQDTATALEFVNLVTARTLRLVFRLPAPPPSIDGVLAHDWELIVTRSQGGLEHVELLADSDISPS